MKIIIYLNAPYIDTARWGIEWDGAILCYYADYPYPRKGNHEQKRSAVIHNLTMAARRFLKSLGSPKWDTMEVDVR